MELGKSISNIVKDTLRCILIGLIIAAGLGILMSLAALIFGSSIPDLISRSCIYVGCFTLFIGGLSFLRPHTQRPLDYKKEWERYFKRMNIGVVILIVGIILLFIGIVLYDITYYYF